MKQCAMDTISIITPSFNQGCFLDDAISSVLNQSGDFFIDYIIVDGGSSDMSVSVIKKYERLLEENCETVSLDGLRYFTNKKSSFKFCNCRGISYRWISEKDNGQANAINKGISRMKGNYFAWLNSDDYYISDEIFSKAISFFNAHPSTGMIYGRGYCVNEQGNIFRDFHDNCTTLGFSHRILKHECFILQPAAFIRSEVVRDTGPIDESFNWCLDWDYWLRIAKKHTIAYFPVWVACWRQYKGIKSFISNKEKVAEFDRILKNYSNFFEYILNRWYYRATMFQLQYLISLRHNYRIKKIVMCGIEVGINYMLRLFMRIFDDMRPSSSMTRIALFMPLEPVDSEITKNNIMMVQELLKKKPGLFVDLYIDADHNPLWFESPRFRIIRHEKFRRHHYIYDMVLYKIGYDYQHCKYMFSYMRRYGGIVEFDDARLNHIYLDVIDELKSNFKRRNFFQCLRICAAYPELRFYAWHTLLKPLRRCNKELYLDRNMYRKSFLVKKAKSVIFNDHNMVNRYRLPRRKCVIIEEGDDISNIAIDVDTRAMEA